MWSLPSSALRLSRLLSSRRDVAIQSLEKMGLAKASALAASALGAPHDLDDPKFDPWHIETFRSLQMRLCHYDNTGYDKHLPAITETQACQVSLTFIKAMPITTQLKLKYVLALFEAGPALLGPKRRARRFTSLSPSDQDVYIRLWSQSRLVPMRAGFHGLKSVAMMGYWTQPSVWPAIDYSLEPDSTEES